MNEDGIVEGGQTAFNPNMKKKMAEARESLTRVENIPEGYIEVQLSTKGKVSDCPAIFYVRNFSPEDLMNLGLADKNDLPIRLIKVLDQLIYNPDPNNKISVKNFHEKEVIELLLLIYEQFYTTLFPNQEWILTEEDWQYLKDISGGENSDEFRQKEYQIKNKTYKPTFDIDICRDIYYYEIDDDFKNKVIIKRKFGGKDFSAVFSIPRFGDFMTLKYFIDHIYKEQDNRFAQLSETLKFRREAEEKLLNGENINLRGVPNIPKAEYEKFREYETEKTLFSITASKALYLVEFDGQDVKNWPLEKKLELAKDPRLDYSTFKAVQDKFNDLQFGYKEEITVVDPILSKTVTRKYTFQLIDLLTAIRDTGTAETTISFV